MFQKQFTKKSFHFLHQKQKWVPESVSERLAIMEWQNVGGRFCSTRCFAGGFHPHASLIQIPLLQRYVPRQRELVCFPDL